MILPYAAVILLLVVTAYSAIVSFRENEGQTSGWMFPKTTGRSSRRAIIVVSVVLIAALAAWVGASARKETHRSARLLIPEGYTGWVRIEFEVQGAPPLPIEDGQYILRIAADGVLRTSSPEQYGWADDHYYYYYRSTQGVQPIPDSGQAEMIWGRINGEAQNASGKRKYEEFFVGTKQQFKNQPN